MLIWPKICRVVPLRRLLRRLDDAGIGLADFQLRSPTLDDVFLTLTNPGEAQR